ncbi:hypothetical protein DDZ13_14180 [Coraliomargarita sinensis]|uniref:Uncharacterized protein n=1 Tax=Coraliomargarita sinensis TaxID=2174842 RepID=A0A317ZDE1_9BACT|nr:hypothetical protein DDZ13_14180 [Coraliomargarita sinensis]
MEIILSIVFFGAIVLACYCIYRLEFFVSRGITEILKVLKHISESLERIESNTRKRDADEEGKEKD